MSRSNIFPGFWGNSRVAQSLYQSVQAQTLAHTLLFTGPAGSGKKTLACKIAQKLFCPQLCGACRNCIMLEKGTHPDLLLAGPEGNSIKIDQSRQLKAFLSAPPNTAPYKVAVLEDCQKLTVEAGNSLLKILEEPPGRSICILTADSPDNVLPTLVSRSLVYNLAPLSTELAEQVLVNHGVSQGQALFIAGFSGGILGKALSMQEDNEFWQQRKNFSVEVQEVLARRRDPLLTAEHWHGLPARFLDLLEFWLRDMLMLETVKGYTPINSDLENALAECVATCPADKTIVLLEECVQARERLNARCNPRLVFDSLLLKMWEV